jgi:hypothetical protein
LSQPVQGFGSSSRNEGFWGFWFGDYVSDVGVSAILAPVDTVDTTSVAPIATITNYGPVLQPVVYAWFRILGHSQAYSQLDSAVNLGAGQSANVVFPVWGGPHDTGTYVIRCSTNLAGDANPLNDRDTGKFVVVLHPGILNGAWVAMADLPPGGKNKMVKDGGALAYAAPSLSTGNDTGLVYAFKGNNTYEFYRYNTTLNTWIARDSVPAIGRSGKKKAVKKGAAMAVGADSKVYGTKGNGTYEFWCYDPGQPANKHWTQLNDVPLGGKPLKEGTGLAAVTVSGTNYIYVLKGSGTYEFYRYQISNGAWATMASAPAGPSNKPYKYGSSIVSDGGDTIWCMKGSYNELFAYSISHNAWITRDTMPKVAPPGTKKNKVKDGSQIAYSKRVVYGLKGGNTDEFWVYPSDSHRWLVASQVPPGARHVKGGGALVHGTGALYAFRGNSTLEFWKYTPVMLLGSDGKAKFDVMGNSQPLSRYALAVVPNPFVGKTQISYSLAKAGNASLKLYDVTGSLVSTLVSGYTTVGAHNAPLSSEKLARGIYLLKFQSEGNTTTTKLIVE